MHNCKRLISLLIAVLGALGLNCVAIAAESYVTVTIPSLAVTINDVDVDYQRARYPFITYQDTTYFPMTYDLCSFLGVDTAWTEQDGLYVAASEYATYNLPWFSRGDNAAGSFVAQVVSFPVYVNGKFIDNSREEYPLLLFRNITYFPLIQRWAKEEFSWEISRDDGLEITKQSVSYFYLLNSDDEGIDIFRRVNSSSQIKYPDKSVGYGNLREMLWYARFNFADESIDLLADMPNSIPQPIPYSAVRLRGNELYYQGAVIWDISDLVELNAQSSDNSGRVYPLSIYSSSIDFDGGYLLEVLVYYANYIPAPYTPYLYYHFVVFDGQPVRHIPMDGKESVLGIHPIPGGIYVSTLWYERQTQSYSISRNLLWFFTPGGERVCINDLHQDFKGIKFLGMSGDTVYLKCQWDPASQVREKRVALINDGYYSMSTDFKLTKLHPYIATQGEACSPDGIIYALPIWCTGIMNLSRGTYIDLSDLPPSIVRE
ncbi:MAG: hypothetical protein FWE76_02480 [Symbiobacteriaceae bacterium]|nr:hypothetical protein [Symbiobacteriaceae bacterium]